MVPTKLKTVNRRSDYKETYSLGYISPIFRVFEISSAYHIIPYAPLAILTATSQNAKSTSNI